MNRLVPFSRGARAQHPDRTIYGFRPRKGGRLRRRLPRLSPFPVVLTLCLLYVGYLNLPMVPATTSPAPSHAQGAELVSASFGKCGSGPRLNCVIDGDTFYYQGRKIRLSGIDTPETHEPQCRQEAELGAAATRRFQELLNAGPFMLVRTGQDEDRYNRKLRDVRRDGHSLGNALVAEGLARPWTGRRMPWCV